MKKALAILIGAALLFSVFSVANAQTSFTPTIAPTTDSKYWVGTTSPMRAYLGVLADQFCLTGDSCISSWATGSVTSVTGTYPVISSGGTTPAISLAFGTTTSNTWAGTQTFTNPPVIGSLTGLLTAQSGAVSSTATTSVTCAGTVSCSTFDVIGASPITITGSGGTNYFTNSGADTYLNTGTNLQAPVLQATSTSAASYVTYRLGVGTTTPVAKFAINPIAGDTYSLAIGSSTASQLYFTTTGRLGIGTANPASLLHVAGTGTNYIQGTGQSLSIFRESANSTLNIFNVAGSDGGGAEHVRFNVRANGTVFIGAAGSTSNRLNISANTAIGANFVSSVAPTNGLIVEGNTGIGTSTPLSLFSVGSSGIGGFRIDANGNATSTGALWLTPLATPAGTFLAADATGRVIATTSPSGASPAGTGTELQYRSNATTFGAVSNSGVSGGNVGIGTTTPIYPLQIFGSAGNTPITTVSTSTDAWGQISRTYATTTTLVPRTQPSGTTSLYNDTGARVAVGSYVENHGMILDHLAGDMRINTGNVTNWECVAGGLLGAAIGVDTSNVCGPYAFTENSTGTLTPSATARIPFLTLASGGTTNNAGNIYVGPLENNLAVASTTPVVEAVIRRTPGTTGWLVVGAVDGLGSTPTSYVNNGCAFVATSTPTFQFMCSSTTVTQFDSGVSVSSPNFVRLRVEMDALEARGYMETATSTLKLIGTVPVGSSYAPTTSTVRPTLRAVSGASAAGSMEIRKINTWAVTPLWAN